jgi:hypothetical protein
VLRMTLFVAFAAALVGLAMSAKAQAWGCLSPGYFNPASSPGYISPASSPGYFNPASSPDYFRPANSPFYGSSTAYGYSPADYSADYSGYSRRW